MDMQLLMCVWHCVPLFHAQHDYFPNRNYTNSRPIYNPIATLLSFCSTKEFLKILLFYGHSSNGDDFSESTQECCHLIPNLVQVQKFLKQVLFSPHNGFQTHFLLCWGSLGLSQHCHPIHVKQEMNKSLTQKIL